MNPGKTPSYILSPLVWIHVLDFFYVVLVCGHQNMKLIDSIGRLERQSLFLLFIPMYRQMYIQDSIGQSQLSLCFYCISYFQPLHSPLSNLLVFVQTFVLTLGLVSIQSSLIQSGLFQTGLYYTLLFRRTETFYFYVVQSSLYIRFVCRLIYE